MSVAEELLQTGEIQGNILRGFNTAVVDLIGLQITGARARPWIASLADVIDSLSSTHQYRLQRTFAPDSATGSVQINAAFSARGLKNVGVQTDAVSDGFFQFPMGSLAGSLGDPVVAGKPSGYCLGTDWNDTPDLLLLVCGEKDTVVARKSAELIAAAEAADMKVCYHELGAKLPGEVEHFGFRDGISQPGLRGLLSEKPGDFLTPRLLHPDDPNFDRFSKPGQQLVWPGQFVFGYATQLPHDPLSRGPKSTGGASWMMNGSFLVFRRLRQDVTRFRTFASELAAAISRSIGKDVSDDYAAALVVGRWRDGTPLLANQAGPLSRSRATTCSSTSLRTLADLIGYPSRMVGHSARSYRRRPIPRDWSVRCSPISAR
jgi:deferrochelatase/peroxidase EfeB